MSKSTYTFDYLGFAHRLMVARAVLGLTEIEAAAAAGCAPNTWKKYETTGKGRPWPILRFAKEYGISLDWMLCGDGARIGAHLAKRAPGKIAILPARAAQSI